METATIKEMFRALLCNDQALTMVAAIVMINTALYITSNLVIYFFKYDFSPEAWQSNYTLFNTFGGAFQILAMMILFPLFRKFMNTINLFYVSFSMAFAGYLILLVIAFSGSTGVYLPVSYTHLKYVGTITEGDLLWGLKKLNILNLKEAEDIAITKIARRADYRPVSADSNMEDLMEKAMDQNFVPVIDDQENFIGIITRKDIIGYCYEKIKKIAN